MLAFQLVTCKRYEFKGHIAIHCYICYMNKSEEEGVFATFRFAWVTMEGADHSCPALELTRVRTALYTQSLHFWRQAPLHILHSEFLTNCNRVREKKNCLYKACCCWFTATVRAWTCEFDCSVCLGLDAEHCQILYECHKSVFTSVFPRTPAGKGKCAWGTWLSLWASNAWIASRKVTFGAAVPQRYSIWSFKCMALCRLGSAVCVPLRVAGWLLGRVFWRFCEFEKVTFKAVFCWSCLVQ